jgi:hypothetical protein
MGCILLAVMWLGSGAAAGDPSLTELSRHLSRQLRAEATAAEDGERDAAIAALCDLYVVMRGDERFPTSAMLRGDAAKLRRRLLSIARRREHRLTRAGIPRPPGLEQRVRLAIDAARSETQTARTLPAEGDPSRRPAAAGGALADGGWGLVALIQRIVAPGFWDATGGKGSIHYFAMRRVLVVRATSDVHQQIKDLLMTLR